MSVKTIVTNMTALQSKYGAPVATIKAALPPLVASDRARGIITTVVDLSDRVQMAKYNAPVVTIPADNQQNKRAIDGVFNGTNPHYLMILGGPDVIPHQTLTNPVPAPDSDPDVPSDLPYACAAAYSQDPRAFTGPTRVVGRLPDVTGAVDPSYLARLLEFIVTMRPAPVANYQAYFGLSTAVWQGSTQLSLTNMFGNSVGLNLSPPSGPDWTLTNLGPLSHFINCHGSSDSPQWSGEGAGRYPPALRAIGINQKITVNTIVAAECCYGAQLYAPPAPGDLSICNTYLLSGAIAFFGSTNIAYGPANTNGSADLITQYMIINMLAGSSAGTAALEARQRFVRVSGPALNPISLKTLAQFVLLGDPSIAPVIAPTPVPLSDIQSDAQIQNRRRRLILQGLFLARNTAVPVLLDPSARSSAMERALLSIARERGLRDPVINSYASRWPGESEALEAIGELPTFHLVASERPAPVPAAIILTVREEEGRIVSVDEDWRH
jgi:hypothetical protein